MFEKKSEQTLPVSHLSVQYGGGISALPMNWIVWRLTLNRFKEWWWCRDLPKKRRKIGVHKNQANYEDVD